ncbi:MAG: HD domain-containing protein [Gammaproteobacteria bacterium]|nr:HD domain-containing protein [Gammaproteobacteria bacterium]
MPLVQLTYAEVNVGVQLRWPVYDQSRRLLYKKGAVIENENQLKLLLRLGLYRVEHEEDDAANLINKEINPFASIAELCLRLDNTNTLLLDPSKAKSTEEILDRVQKVVTKLILLTEEDTDATLGAIHLDRDGMYTLLHPIHSALLSYLIAKSLDYAPDRVFSIMSAALTANLGMLEIQDELQSQSKALTEQQRKLIDTHPRRSVEILQKAGVTDKLWLNIVYQHHEKIDGTGYPRKLVGKDILQESKIVSLADRYHALITHRSDRNAMAPTQVLKSLFLEQGKEIDEGIAQLFIKTLGVFPPGAIVSLTNGEIAIVTRRGTDKMKPTVRSVINNKNTPYSRPLLRNTEHDEYKLVGLAPIPKIPMIALMRLWEYD